MADTLVPILIITVLILINGLFVAAEFAIVGAPRPAIERRASAGQRAAKLVASILRDPREQDRFIATAQLGITLASLGLGMYGEHLLAVWIADQLTILGAGRWIAAHTLGSIGAITILTYFHIVVGEMVPKSIALQRAEHTVLWIAPVMRVVQLAVYPFVVLLNGIGNGVLRLAGIHRDAAHADHYRTPEDLAYLVRESQVGGLLRSEAARVVAELLDFGELTAGEVMVPRVRVIGIPLGAGAADIRRVLHEQPHSRYPVYDGSIDVIVGMLHVKDILRCLPACTALRLDQVRPVPHVPATASMDQVIAALRRDRVQMAVVMDEHGGTAGILTSEDLFEEVVGDVGDEDVAQPELTQVAAGRVRATGLVRLEALGDALGVELERDDVDTVSGLVLALLGRPPATGDAVETAGIRLEVTRVQGRGVSEVIAILLPTADDD
ncbi:MAG: HlyC/CorC family transporter [Gemmatimonadaceae bacterium]|nr:HlyC/CorC family transporter [Gemmatimonadaceae bacterium]